MGDSPASLAQRSSASAGSWHILSPHAIGALSAGAVSAMSAVGAAVIKKHKHAMDKNPESFWHMFANCEAKAARIAERAARAPQACRDAAFIET